MVRVQAAAWVHTRKRNGMRAIGTLTAYDRKVLVEIAPETQMDKRCMDGKLGQNDRVDTRGTRT